MKLGKLLLAMVVACGADAEMMIVMIGPRTRMMPVTWA